MKTTEQKKAREQNEVPSASLGVAQTDKTEKAVSLLGDPGCAHGGMNKRGCAVKEEAAQKD